MSDRLFAETATRPVGPPEPDPDMPERLGAFKLVKALGRGGMGVVYLAEDTQLGRPAAVKVMRPAAAAFDPRAHERFLREARAAAAVRHPNVVTVYQVGEENGTPYLAMELLRGTTLSDYLDKKPAVGVGVACRLGREVAEGLAGAHQVGLLHRDVKPGNIWLEAPNGRVKLLDFGLARPAGPEGPGPDRLTCTGIVVGTPGYMSPEQARGEPLDERTDLFSLGAVLYLLCTGKEPFAGLSPTAVLTALAVDRQTPACEMNPKVPAALSALIDRLLEKKPADRPASAREVAKALRQIERGQVPTLLPPMAQPTQPAGGGRSTDHPKSAHRPRGPKAGRRVRQPQRSPAVWIVVAIACALPTLLGAAWLIAHEDRPARSAEPGARLDVRPGPPFGFGPPPPKGPLLPGMPGFGPPPEHGPGSPGFGPPPHPFPPPPKD